MVKSLQDQLLGVGLVDGKKAKKISKETRKEKKQKGKTKQPVLTEAQLAARQLQQEKLERDQALNKELKLTAEKKAIAAQIAQLANHYKVERKLGDSEYNFTDNNKIKKLAMTQALYDELVRGRLCIVRLDERYELIPKPIAEKIRERDATVIVVNNSISKTSANQISSKPEQEQDNAVQSDEDYYAQFEIPDDLTW